MQKNILISLFVAVLIITGAMFFSFRGGVSTPSSVAQLKQKQADVFFKEGTNVKIENDTQIISLGAKGGYYPRKTIAQANKETVLRIQTAGTYDCSAALTIPKMNFRKILAPTGVEEIRIPASEAKGTLQGLCSMGMYGFTVDFR
jgi:plastocyanin domain-containing protein